MNINQKQCDGTTNNIEAQASVWKPYWLESIGVALLYFVSAKIGQNFSIPPGNITPVWLPSGLMLALVMLRGYRLWLGIFIGAFAGNVSTYLNLSSSQTFINAITAGTINGTGDILAIVGSVYLFNKVASNTNPFSGTRSFWLFLFICTIAGPMLSALFGVSGLALTGHLPWNQFSIAFITWWTGDGVGVLLMGLPILSFFFLPKSIPMEAKWTEIAAYAICLVLVCLAMLLHKGWPVYLPSPLFFSFPLLLWSVFRTDLRITTLSFIALAVVSIYISNQHIGPFISTSQVLSLIQLQLFLSLVIIPVLIIGILSNERNQLIQKLAHASSYDALTGVANRRLFMQQIAIEVERQVRYGSHFCLIMLDIDYFKQINDDFGHKKGDDVLIELAQLISQEMRDIDTLARWGGEEFLIMLPNTSIQGAVQLAERCRSKTELHDFQVGKTITISLGVVESRSDLSVNEIIQQSDNAMYQSKQNGRNRVTPNINTY